MYRKHRALIRFLFSGGATRAALEVGTVAFRGSAAGKEKSNCNRFYIYAAPLELGTISYLFGRARRHQ